MTEQTQTATATANVLYVAPLGNCGGGTPNCYATIQSAVDVANPGDEIRVAAGTWTDLSIRPDAWNTGVVTQVVYVSKTLTIQGGYATTNWTTPNPSLNISKLDAQNQGGGIYVTGNYSVTISGLSITRANASGIDVFTATVMINNNQVFANNNTADWGCGGGIAIGWSATASINNNNISNNTASCGGGLKVDGYAALTGNLITSNSASSYGGGIATYGGCLVLNRNRILNNTAASEGGGLSAHFSGARTPPCTSELFATSGDGNIILGNTAGYGGGFTAGDSSKIMFTNTVIADNQSSLQGSAVHDSFNSTVHLVHNTITRNSGGDGSGIFVGNPPCCPWGGPATIVLTNTVLVSHTFGISVTNGSTANVNSILWFNSPITISQGSTAIVSIQNQYQGNPAFTSDGYHLQATSAAIDKGVNAGVLVDIDGNPRPNGTAPDLGAVEYWALNIFKIYLPLILHNH
jgi:hypothetical protein